MITNVKKWYYLALKWVRTNGYNRPIKGFSGLLRGISSNHVGDYYCLNCSIYNFCRKKSNFIKTILKHLTQRKKLSMSLQVTH